MATIKIKAAPEAGTQQFIPYRALPQLPYVKFPNPTSGLAKGLKELASSFDKMSKSALTSFKSGLEVEFLNTLADVNNYAMEEYRKSPPDGVGYTEKVGNYYTAKQAEFFKKIDSMNISDADKRLLKQEYAKKFMAHQLKFEPKIYSQEVNLHDNKIKLDYERMVRAGESELFSNPSSLKDVQNRVLQSIDSLPLPAIERENLKLNAKRRLQSAALRFEAGDTYIDSVLTQIFKHEGTGKNKTGSTSAGIGQFTEGTWLSLIRKYFPKYYEAMPKKALLDLRNDPSVARQIGKLYLRELSVGLKRNGFDPSPGLLRMAWFFGDTKDLYNVLKADPNTPVSSLVRPIVMKQNPFLRKHTAGSLKRFFFNQMKKLGDPYPDVPADLKTQLVAVESEKTLAVAQGSMVESQMLMKESFNNFVNSLIGLSPEDQLKKLEEAKKNGLLDMVSGSNVSRLEKKIRDKISDRVLTNIRIAEVLGKDYNVPTEILGSLNKETQRAYASFKKKQRNDILNEGKKLANEGSPLFKSWYEAAKKNPYLNAALPEIERLKQNWEKKKDKAEVEMWVHLGDPAAESRIQRAFKKGAITAEEREKLLKIVRDREEKATKGLIDTYKENIRTIVDRGLADKKFIEDIRNSKGLDREFRDKIYRRWKEVEAEKKRAIEEKWNETKDSFDNLVVSGDYKTAEQLANIILKSDAAPVELKKHVKKFLEDRFSYHISVVKTFAEKENDPEKAFEIVRMALNRIDPAKYPKEYSDLKKLEREYQKKIYKKKEEEFITDAKTGDISAEDVQRAWDKKEPWLSFKGYKEALSEAKRFENNRIKAEEEKNLNRFQEILVEVSEGRMTPDEAKKETNKLFKGRQYKYEKQIDTAYEKYRDRVEKEAEKSRLIRLVSEGGYIDPNSDAGKLLNNIYQDADQNTVRMGDQETAANITAEYASKYKVLPKSLVSDIQSYLFSNDVRVFSKGVEMLFRAEKESPYVVNQLNEDAKNLWSYISVLREYGVDTQEAFQRLQAVRELLADSRKRKDLDTALEEHIKAKGDLNSHIVELIGADGYMSDAAKTLSGAILLDHYKKLYKVFKPLLGDDDKVDEAIGRIMRRMWGPWDSKHNEEGLFGTKTRFMLLPPNLAYPGKGTGELGFDYSWVDDWLDSLAEKYGYDRIVIVADKQSIDEYSRGKPVTYQAYGIKKNNYFPVPLPERVKPDLSFIEKKLKNQERALRSSIEEESLMNFMAP